MHINDRREKILMKTLTQGSIEVVALANELSVSNMTIRRDLDYLEKNNKVIRTFGGAIPSVKIVNEVSFQMKENKFIAEKRRIAEKAINAVKDYSTILLDSGTTTLEIAKLLHTKKSITVITNDIKIAGILMDSSAQVIIVGGLLQNSTGAILGAVADAQLKKIHVDIAFIGAHAIDREAGITVPSIEKAMLKRTMLYMAQKNIVVVDSSKFNMKSLMEVCSLKEIHKVITNESVEKKYSLYEDLVEIELG